MERQQGWSAPPTDDVERLLARLEPPPIPAGLAGRVLARTTRERRARSGSRLPLAVLGGLLAAVFAALSGYWTGRELVASGAFELLRLVLEERELVLVAPADFLLALAQTVPWLGLLATLLCIVAAYLMARPMRLAAGEAR